ncbi:MAG: hypothetical protein AMXMBFR72_01000 [Betaproteobacteria bacterium]
MTEPTERVAIITVHGVADQRPGQTVRELARLLCHGGDGAPRYVEGELHEVIVPVSPLAPAREAEPAGAPTEASKPRPGRPSDFFLAQRARAPDADLGLALTEHLLRRYRPAERDALYESTRISLKRREDGTPVDLYELYWADFSRLQPGGIRALSASYQLFFHLGTLARDIVDQAVLATGGGRALRALQKLHAWSAWLLKGPAALLQLAMLLLVAFGTAALVPPAQHRFVLALGGGVGAVALAILALLAAQRANGAVAKSRAALPWVAAAAAATAIALTAIAAPGAIAELYFATAILLTAAVGLLLVRRYGETVRGVRSFGFAAVAAAAVLLAVDAARMRAHVATLYEWMLTAALHAGEYLLAALLSAWAVLALVQIAALVLGFALARSAERELAASLATARIGMVVSTALFALLSVVLWSVLAYVTGLALKDLLFEPAVFGSGYRSAAIFFEAQVQDVGGLFTPLLALAGLVGGIVLVALAPSLREEIAPSADARSPVWSARLGRWWTRGRTWLGGLFGVAVPLAAIAGGVVYLLFLLEKFFGVHGAFEWIDARDEVLVTIGKWLAGGAVTITALGARFTQTFGKLRVALDAVLDVDNYFRDPADRRPPRARIFSRYAALLDYVRARDYTRVVIIAHSQGTVISADLLRYLRLTDRLRALTEAMPIALVTLGCPLRDLYAARFPLLYRWMSAAPASFAEAGPPAAELGVAHWVNAYRSGDYVGRALWTPGGDDALFRVATVDEERRVRASRAGDRTEFCLGAGAHTHYFTNDAVALAVEVDRLVARRIGLAG